MSHTGLAQDKSNSLIVLDDVVRQEAKLSLG